MPALLGMAVRTRHAIVGRLLHGADELVLTRRSADHRAIVRFGSPVPGRSSPRHSRSTALHEPAAVRRLVRLDRAWTPGLRVCCSAGCVISR